MKRRTRYHGDLAVLGIRIDQVDGEIFVPAGRLVWGVCFHEVSFVPVSVMVLASSVLASRHTRNGAPLGGGAPLVVDGEKSRWWLAGYANSRSVMSACSRSIHGGWHSPWGNSSFG